MPIIEVVNIHNIYYFIIYGLSTLTLTYDDNIDGMSLVVIIESLNHDHGHVKMIDNLCIRIPDGHS